MEVVDFDIVVIVVVVVVIDVVGGGEQIIKLVVVFPIVSRASISFLFGKSKSSTRTEGKLGFEKSSSGLLVHLSLNFELELTIETKNRNLTSGWRSGRKPQKSPEEYYF